jgi:uncharacterized membrane protein YheB (UPF0754 family)
MHIQLKILNKGIASVSCLTVAIIIICAICKKSGFSFIPEWFLNWGLPVLTAGAVGYLTNYVAIWLLFKPYRPIHWLWNVQGVIPREQPNLAKRLGEEIPKNLLPPEELADLLGTTIKSYLKNAEFLDDIRRNINLFFNRYKNNITSYLIPHIELAVQNATDNNFTAEKLRNFYDTVVGQWLARPSIQQWLASGVVSELKARTPEFTFAIKDMVRDGAQTYVREEYPTLSSWIHADEFAAQMVKKLNWNRIQENMQANLAKPETQAAICEELIALSGRFSQYLHSSSISAEIRKIITEGSSQEHKAIRVWLELNINDIIDEHLRRDELWKIIKTQLLPMAQSFIIHRLNRDTNAITDKLNISRRIEESILRQNPQDIHELINRVSGEHLVYLQLLGYGLGLVAGFLLVLAQ